MRRTTLTLVLFGAAALGAASAACAAADDDDAAGRDFPKTLVVDEPGIDDEVSLPTLSFLRHGARADAPGYGRSDVAFEFDKRITDDLDIQINTGWSSLGPRGDGWDDTTITFKYVAVNQPERVISFGVTRTLGGAGAARTDAARAGVTAPALYVGQGFALIDRAPDWLRPVALTGTAAWAAPDAPGPASPARIVLGGSLQYSLEMLARQDGSTVPAAFRRVIPLVEVQAALPTTRDPGHDAREIVVAPGLLYAGEGYQLGVEALVPLTRATGGSVGVVAQLNLLLSNTGIAALSRPLF